MGTQAEAPRRLRGPDPGGAADAAAPRVTAAAQAHLAAVGIAAPIGMGLWLWMAWAVGSGHDWARRVFAAFFSLMTLSLLGLLAGGAAVYAPAELIATAVVWLVQLAVMVLIFGKTSAPYYQHEPAGR